MDMVEILVHGVAVVAIDRLHMKDIELEILNFLSLDHVIDDETHDHVQVRGNIDALDLLEGRLEVNVAIAIYVDGRRRVSCRDPESQ